MDDLEDSSFTDEDLSNNYDDQDQFITKTKAANEDDGNLIKEQKWSEGNEELLDNGKIHLGNWCKMSVYSLIKSSQHVLYFTFGKWMQYKVI